MENDIFKYIMGQESGRHPDVFVWGGDVVYTDNMGWNATYLNLIGKPAFNSLEFAKEKYQHALDYPFYREMKQQGTKVIGIWDDHDYGINDGNRTYVQKKDTRKLFLDFVEEPADTARRLDDDSAIYQDYTIVKNGFKTHILLLDNRYSFDYATNDRLGPEQWAWLEKALATH